jgi:transcriptional regulator with XRE-family HTH domain
MMGFCEMTKTSERKMARQLRQQKGMSVKEIARTIGVARSSVSMWVRQGNRIKNEAMRKSGDN